jgi:uncharacterized protein (DUF486 family)
VKIPVLAQTVGLLVVCNVSMTFAMLHMNDPFKLDYPWAALCIMGAVYFISRS